MVETLETNEDMQQMQDINIKMQGNNDLPMVELNQFDPDFNDIEKTDLNQKINSSNKQSESNNHKSQWVQNTDDEFENEKSGFKKCCPCINLSFLNVYFDVTTGQIKKRLMTSLIPFNRSFYQIYSEKPDLYGPFWILTSLIVVLFISGNVARYAQMGHEKFTYNFSMIPVASIVIYGIGFGLPTSIKLIVQCYGKEGAPRTPIVTGVGIYCYSFSSFLITILLCAIPVDALQWVLISYSALTSIGFLYGTYSADFEQNLQPKYKYALITFIAVVQLILVLMFKLYFFKHVVDESTSLK